MADRFRVERLEADENGVVSYAVYDEDQRGRGLSTRELVSLANKLDAQVLRYENRERDEPEAQARPRILGAGCGLLTIPVLLVLVGLVCCGLTFLIL